MNTEQLREAIAQELAEWCDAERALIEQAFNSMLERIPALAQPEQQQDGKPEVVAWLNEQNGEIVHAKMKRIRPVTYKDFTIPLVRLSAADQKEQAPAAQGECKQWRCFHCDEVFTDPEEAQNHFGKTLASEPICKVDQVKFREMEELNRRHCEEDTELHREIYRLQSKHRTELQREEEKGYARGLEDAKKEQPPASAQAPTDERVSELEEENEELLRKLSELANEMIFNGNSVAYIYQKKDVYSKAIGDAWDALQDGGFQPDGETPLSEMIRRALSSNVQPSVNEWKEALINECVICHIGWGETDAKKTLHNLISWHTEVALDPSVSQAAQELVERGKGELSVNAEVRSPRLGQLPRNIEQRMREENDPEYAKRMDEARKLLHADQAAVIEVRRQTLEEAAKICDEQAEAALTSPGNSRESSCADRIRSLIDQPRGK